MGYHVSSLESLGDGFGFRKVREPLGVTAFGVNALVFPPGYEGPAHYHDLQDELYFVHSGSAIFTIGEDVHAVEAGGLVHVESTTPRQITNPGTDELVLLIVGGKDGYVERDGHLVDLERDLPRRQGLSNGGAG
jgi:mannose-6-phosphate isomerase-like protein (cupin superfamily)